MRSVLLLAVCSLALPAACSQHGGHATGPAGSLDGNTAGGDQPFAPFDALFRPALPYAAAAVLITDYTFACEDEIASRWVAGSHALEIDMVGLPLPQSGQLPFPTGSFPVESLEKPGSVMVTYYAFGATCLASTSFLPSAQSGSVTLAMNEAGELTGTLDVTFRNDDHLTGSFAAHQCPALAERYTGQDPPACGRAIVCTSLDGGVSADASSDAGDAASPVSVQMCQ